MDKFEIKKHTYSNRSNPVSVYVHCETSTVNPLEVEKDINNFVEFMQEKYKIKSTTLTFKEWLKDKLGCNG